MKMEAAIYYGLGDIRIEEIERPHAKPYRVGTDHVKLWYV